MQEEDPWFEFEERPGMDAVDPHPGIVYRAYSPFKHGGGGISGGRGAAKSWCAWRAVRTTASSVDVVTDQQLRALAAYRRMVRK